jgi:hypothetical protein
MKPPESSGASICSRRAEQVKKNHRHLSMR